ncbi:MAG: hypothetical protein QXX41_05720 [Nitrososphaerota archaeon]
MATLRDVGVSYGGQHIGKGLSKLLTEIDKIANKATAPVFERPSTWITIAAAAGLPAAAIFFKLRDPWDKLAILVGGFISTNLWNIIEEAAAATPTVTFVPTEVSPAPTEVTEVSPAPTF